MRAKYKNLVIEDGGVFLFGLYESMMSTSSSTTSPGAIWHSLRLPIGRSVWMRTKYKSPAANSVTTQTHSATNGLQKRAFTRHFHSFKKYYIKKQYVCEKTKNNHLCPKLTHALPHLILNKAKKIKGLVILLRMLLRAARIDIVHAHFHTKEKRRDEKKYR